MITPEHQTTLSTYSSQIPVSVGSLARELGLSVSISSLSPSISGLIEPDSTTPSQFRIRINRYESEERQRFTIAHEIAHYLLHREYIRNGIVDSVMYRSSLSSKREAEANRLAADIIMPMARLSDELQRLGGVRDDATAIALARLFKVSIPAMKVRLGIS